MSSLESIRTIHEEIELLEEAGSRFLSSNEGKLKRVRRDHGLYFLRNVVEERVRLLTNFYHDIDSTKSDALVQLGSDSGSDIWSIFYVQLKVCSGRYRANQSDETFVRLTDSEYWYEQIMNHAMQKEGDFSGSEVKGCFVDLSNEHNEYLNLRKLRDFHIREFIQSEWIKHSRRHPEDTDFDAFRIATMPQWLPLDYVSWLRELDLFEQIPRHIKYRQIDYRLYVERLLGYLTDFITRQQPLFDIDHGLSRSKDEFDSRWAMGSIPGWNQKTCESPLYAIVTDRLFTTELAMNGHVSSKEYRRSYAKFEALSEKDRESLVKSSQEHDYNIALLESRVKYIRGLLNDTFLETIDHVTRKQARTSYEIEADIYHDIDQVPSTEASADLISDQSSSGGEEVDTDDRAIYNPKNLPMGPDGKPIPYWQYKLFGLDKEFKCEICGNYSYFGRRAFEKHFSEWRHIYGLKALRIQTSNHFFGITGIEEAISLSEVLWKKTLASVFNAEKDMECEDGLGNVMSYRAYQDLVRQGMI
jgi:splicing factor 3A subunit 3